MESGRRALARSLLDAATADVLSIAAARVGPPVWRIRDDRLEHPAEVQKELGDQLRADERETTAVRARPQPAPAPGP